MVSPEGKKELQLDMFPSPQSNLIAMLLSSGSVAVAKKIKESLTIPDCGPVINGTLGGVRPN
jgi:hypothetical protein